MKFENGTKRNERNEKGIPKGLLYIGYSKFGERKKIKEKKRRRSEYKLKLVIRNS